MTISILLPYCLSWKSIISELQTLLRAKRSSPPTWHKLSLLTPPFTFTKNKKEKKSSLHSDTIHKSANITRHNPPQSAHVARHNPQHRLPTSHDTIHNTVSTNHTTQSTTQSPHVTRHNAQHSLHTSHNTIHNTAHITWHNPQNSLHTLHGTICIHHTNSVHNIDTAFKSTRLKKQFKSRIWRHQQVDHKQKLIINPINCK